MGHKTNLKNYRKTGNNFFNLKLTDLKSNSNLKRETKLFLLLAIIVVGFGFVLINSGGIMGAVVGVGVEAEVSAEVVDAFAAGNEAVSVIVLLKNNPQTAFTGNDNQNNNQISDQEKEQNIKDNQAEVLNNLNLEEKETAFGLLNEEKEFELKHQYNSLNALAGEVTEAGLEKLKDDPNVEKVILNGVKHIFLADSVPLINADDAHSFLVGEQGITGKGEAVCVVDTGVDYTHAALGGCTTETFLAGECGTVVAGYDFLNNDPDPLDDQGHGTHVAGIIASNDEKYKGVAPEAKIVAVKVCDAQGSCSDADVLAGIESCITNSAAYGISVISISLGGDQYASYCDTNVSLDGQYAVLINEAVQQNISVVIASGNTYGSYTNPIAGVTAPACVEKAIRVTATDKSDNLASYAFRNSFFTDIIAAPGSSITSLKLGGGTRTLSGTSMSTPHVAAAAALMNQFWKLAYQQTPTPEQIEQKLLLTGTVIADPLEVGANYPRIDMLAALKPVISFTSTNPADGFTTDGKLVVINVSSDISLSAAVLELTKFNVVEGNIVNEAVINYTMNKNSDGNGGESDTSFYYALTDLAIGTYTYHVFGSDVANIQGLSSARDLVVTNFPPEVAINSPSSGAKFSNEVQLFNATVTDETGTVDAVLFRITNGLSENGSINFIEVAASNEGLGDIVSDDDLNNYWSASVDMASLSEEVHTVTVVATDSFGETNSDQSLNFTVDRTAPVVSLESPANNSIVEDSNLITFNYNVNDLLLGVTNCSLYLNGLFNESALSIVKSTTQSFTKQLSNGEYWWTVQCVDELGNGLSTEENELRSRAFTLTVSVPELDAVAPVVTLTAPSNNYITSNTTVDFSCSAIDETNLANLTLYGNWGGEWQAKETLALNTAAGETALALFTKTLPAGSYSWNCLAQDSVNAVFASSNYTLTIDTTVPEISGVTAESITETAAEIVWDTNENTNSTLDYGTMSSLGNQVTSSALTTGHGLTITSLTKATTYYYAVSSCDPAGNCRIASQTTFVTAGVADEVPSNESESSESDSDSSSSSGSSSGGGGGSSSTASANSDEEVVEEEEFVEETPEEPAVVEETPVQEEASGDLLTSAAVTDEQATVEEAKKSYGSMLTGWFSAIVPQQIIKKEYLIYGLAGLSALLLGVYLFISRRGSAEPK
ncbi:MAG: S8 family serine peptidase [Nanoarchaeota archaeon]